MLLLTHKSKVFHKSITRYFLNETGRHFENKQTLKLIWNWYILRSIDIQDSEANEMMMNELSFQVYAYYGSLETNSKLKSNS